MLQRRLTSIKPGAFEGVFAQCVRPYVRLFSDRDEREAILHEINR